MDVAHRRTLNSDDPAFISSHLGEEYAELARAFDYGFDAMAAIALAGVDAAWLTASEKAALAGASIGRYN